MIRIRVFDIDAKLLETRKWVCKNSDVLHIVRHHAERFRREDRYSADELLTEAEYVAKVLKGEVVEVKRRPGVKQPPGTVY
jgi:hypothetical protein